MQTYVEFELNGLGYSAAETLGGFVWGNDRGEESSRFHATLLEAQQGAIDWERGRRERYEGSEEEVADARDRYLNQRCDDARGASR